MERRVRSGGGALPACDTPALAPAFPRGASGGSGLGTVSCPKQGRGPTRPLPPAGSCSGLNTALPAWGVHVPPGRLPSEALEAQVWSRRLHPSRPRGLRAEAPHLQRHPGLAGPLSLEHPSPSGRPREGHQPTVPPPARHPPLLQGCTHPSPHSPRQAGLRGRHCSPFRQSACGPGQKVPLSTKGTFSRLEAPWRPAPCRLVRSGVASTGTVWTHARCWLNTEGARPGGEGWSLRPGAPFALPISKPAKSTPCLPGQGSTRRCPEDRRAPNLWVSGWRFPEGNFSG